MVFDDIMLLLISIKKLATWTLKKRIDALFLRTAVAKRIGLVAKMNTKFSEASGNLSDVQQRFLDMVRFDQRNIYCMLTIIL